MAKKSQRFSKIYREFTRVKFNKYKLQYPRIRQSQIIAKIIKEWEAMDENAKQNLQKQYVQRSGKGFLEDPSSSDKLTKQKLKQKSPPMSASAILSSKKNKPIKKKKKPSPKVRVFQDKQKPQSPQDLENMFSSKKDKENSKSPGKKSSPSPSKNQTSSELAIQNAKGSKTNKSKGIPLEKQKLKNQEYVTFYKYYYQRLSAEHPRWLRSQITTIIKLLWKKRHIKVKKPKSISGKGLSGRQLYNRTKQNEGLLKDQIKQLWRSLPHQSKKYWQIRGRGKPNRSQKDSGKFVRRVLNSGASKASQSTEQVKSSFNWMNNSIN